MLLRFGGWVTISAFVGPLMTVFDRFVIGSVKGAVAVTIYTVPWQLAQRLLLIPSSLQVALFPRQAAASPVEQNRLTLAGVRAIAVIMTPIVVLATFFFEPLLHVWIGTEYSVATGEVGRIALLGFWGNCLAYVPFSQVEARGDARTAALVHLGELIPYMILLFGLLHWIGVAGAAIAFTIRSLADALIFNRVALRGDAPWLLITTTTAMLTGGVLAAQWFAAFTWLWGLALVASLLGSLACFHAFAPSELVSFLTGIVKRTLGKITARS